MAKKSNPLDLTNEIKNQLNTRISYRMRKVMDRYIIYMQKPIAQRPQHTDDWPSNIVDIMDDALTTFFADHPRSPRKGPKIAPEPKTNAKKKTSSKKRTSTHSKRTVKNRRR